MYYAQRLVNLADINVERTTEINKIFTIHTNTIKDKYSTNQQILSISSLLSEMDIF